MLSEARSHAEYAIEAMIKTAEETQLAECCP